MAVGAKGVRLTQQALDMDGWCQGVLLGISYFLLLVFSPFRMSVIAGFIARLAGHFHGRHEVQDLDSVMMGPASFGRSPLHARNTKQQMYLRISSQYALGSVWQ
jgi:hypothetical protein